MERKLVEKKMQVFLAVIAAIFLILTARLLYMQIVHNDRYSTMAKENRMRLITIPAPRGEVFDRNGVKIVGNQPVYTVFISLINLGQEDLNKVIPRLASLLSIDPQEIQDKVKQQKRKYEPVKIATKAPLEVVIKIEEQRLELPGVVIDIEPLREYPNGSILSHVMGYVRQINEQQLAANREKGYKMGDPYGQTGLELAYEHYLRGQDGGKQVEVDIMGRPVRDLGIKQPVPGNNLVLTVDYKVQRAAEEALARSSEAALKAGNPEARAGAAVAMDVRTGAVLAMASYPAYDPVKLSGVLTQQDYNDIFNNPWKPLLNRAMMAYAPGSTYKMIVAIAGLESGKLKPNDQIYDSTGRFFWKNQVYKNAYGSGHGRVDLIRAIKVSSNVFFYQLGLAVGIDEIARVSRDFGLGVKTEIELPGENEGVVGSPLSKFQQHLFRLDSGSRKKAREIEQKYNELLANAANEDQRRDLMRKRSDELRSVDWDLDWHDYDTIISSIGQGENRYTLLQLANYTAIMANGGIRYKPYLVQKIVDPNGKTVEENHPVVLSQANVTPQNLALIRQGMYEATLPPDGTAVHLFPNFPSVAAKTGTAQVFGRKDNAMFLAFAPYEAPEIAIAVVMEHAGYGGAAAGPVARAMLAAYFGLPEPGMDWLNITNE